MSEEWLIGIFTGIPLGAAITCFSFGLLAKPKKEKDHQPVTAEFVSYNEKGEYK